MPNMLTILVILLVVMTIAFVFTTLRLLLQRRSILRDELSAVSRQHIDLFQGGQLSESAVESTKARYRELLERGEFAAVEASLRAGMQFVVQVRALAELGTDDAGKVLERQLQRRLTDDQIEQSWYWIDLATGLRSLNRSQALPHLLRCAEVAGDTPLGSYFAAETVCFLGFAGYLRSSQTALGRAALRVLHRTLDGLCSGIPPGVVAEARVGEMIENLWDQRSDTIDPLAVRIFVASLRVVRRAQNAEAALAGDPGEREAFGWQISRLSALEPAVGEYLKEAPTRLLRRLQETPEQDHHDILLALHDLRADTRGALLPVLDRNSYTYLDAAISILSWSTEPHVAQRLRQFAIERVPMVNRSRKRRRSSPPRRPSVSQDTPYRAILRALQHHGSPETEAFLMLAARDWDPTYRAHAVASLGWWEPLSRVSVLSTLQDARRDACPEVRQAARAALARLGERQALQWFRQGLTSEDPQRVYEAIQSIASEGLTLLWPDLDRLADAEESEVVHHAREALERLCEEIDRRPR
jgi:hypothetical protein